MGPRFCKRGNIEATAHRYSFAELQWGHAFVSVETRWSRSNHVADVDASMGPRFCKRGNNFAGRASTCDALRLQWGHAFVSVETVLELAAGHALLQLQWGHAFVSVETPAPLSA